MSLKTKLKSENVAFEKSKHMRIVPCRHLSLSCYTSNDMSYTYTLFVPRAAFNTIRQEVRHMKTAWQKPSGFAVPKGDN
jgi:hypothetical protein